MTKELEDWHDQTYWPKYCQMLLTPTKTKWGPGGRGKSKAKILRMKPSKALREKIIQAIDKQTAHREQLCARLGIENYLKRTGDLAKTGNGDIYQNRQSLTWLNAMGWEDEIPNIPAFMTPVNKTCSCGQPVHGDNSKCMDCLSEIAHRARMDDYLKVVK